MPELQSQGSCQACGRPIAWVQLAGTRGHKRPVDPTPHSRGEYVLMRDGRTVATPRQDPRVAFLDDRAGIEEIRYFDHNKTCPIPSLRTFADGAALLFSRGVYGYDGRPSRGYRDPVREARRTVLLEQHRLHDLSF